MSHTAVPPDIERISPLDPRERPILLPIRESPLLKVSTFSLVTTTPEREFRFPLSVAIFPVAVARFVLILVIFPFIPAIDPVSPATVPDNAFCARILVK